MIVVRLLKDRFFRIIAYRKTYNTLADSCFKNIVDDIKFFQLEQFFSITKSPLSIKCKLNENCVYFRGGDQVDKIKSIKEATALWVEEDVFDTYEEFVTVDSSLRSLKAENIQTYFTINPVFEGDFSENWYYKYFGYADNNSMDFTHIKSVDIEGTIYEQSIRAIHSTFRDNKFLTNDFIAKMELLKNDDPYLYSVNNLGIFARKTIEGRFYKSFDITKNIGEYKYDRDRHIYMGIDFNSLPFTAIVLFQIDGKKLYQIDEICVNDPKESSISVALKEFSRRYKGHYLDVFVIGDATSKKDDAAHEKGYNNFTIISNQLGGDFKICMHTPSMNPSVIARGGFTNDVFLNKGNDKYGGLEFCINSKCTNTINDFLYTKIKEDSTQLKEMVKNKETGQSYEKYSHCSDSATYILCREFMREFEQYKNLGGGGFNPIMVKRIYKH